jgi:hypothetical protein
VFRSRWGVFAVNDHLDAARLVPEVLLYDRLVFPYPVGDDRARWLAEGWDPDRLDARLDLLGGLAESVPWDATRREEWRSRLADIRADVADMEQEKREALGYANTRRVLAQNVRPDSSLVDVVAAYPSRADLDADHILGEVDDSVHASMALQYEFLTPAPDRDPEDVLVKTIRLAQSTSFRESRQEFYHWQAEYLGGKLALTPQQAVEAMRTMATKYNEAVRAAELKLLKRTAFVVASAATSVAGSLITMNPLPLAGTMLTLIAFLTLDRKPAVSVGRAGPAAMFHEAAPFLGLR